MQDMLLSGRYELQAELGRGGMGVVYRAHDTLLDRDVAVKLLTRQAIGAEGRVRLLNEARAVARLNHPNIVAVYDAGETEGAPFVVMELVEGASLHDRPPRELETIVSITRQVCAALAHAHAHQIIHRDLKPENVIVTTGGVVKLMDFGLARSVASRVSTEGTITGTVFYLAPELALGQPFDGRADLYALGVMLYELTTGHLPFTADDPLAVISQHLYAPVVPPCAHNPDIPPGLEALIVQLLAKRPEDRPATADAVRAQLDHLDAVPVAPTLQEPSLLDRIARGRFVARHRELAQAEAEWQRARNGEGHVLLISGEPGIGKTRFVRELLTQVQVSGGRVLTGECYADAGAPYASLAQIIRDGWDLVPPGVGLAEPVLADLVALVPDLHARYPDLSPTPTLDPQAELQRVFESVVAWCAALATHAPLVLFIDDVHWADGATLAMLRHLARRTRKQRLLIVATYREVELDETRPWNQMLLDLNRERLATRIKLTRLSCDDTCDLLTALFQEPVSSDLLDAIYRETEGNPFFVEEVIKALVEEGKLVFAGGRWQQADMREIEIPQSVRLAIQARAGNLPPDAQETLRLAAVLGREFDFETLEQASELSEETLIAALEIAERAQLIQELRGRNSHITYAFAHALIWLTLEESVSGLRRKRMHRRAAAAFESVHPDDYELIARHHEAAGDADRARSYYLRAGHHALAVYAYQEAEAAFRAGLDLGGSDVERLDMLSGLGQALAARGRFDEAIRTCQDAIQQATGLKDYAHVAELYARSSRDAWLAGDMARGLALAREGVRAVEGHPETAALARLLHETARACFFNGLPEEARPLCERALDIARRNHDVQAESETLVTMGLLYGVEHRGADEEQAYRQAIALGLAAHLPGTVARAYHNLANLIRSSGQMREACDYAWRAAAAAQQAGLFSMRILALEHVIYSAAPLGDYPTMEKAFGQLRDQVHAMDAGWSLEAYARMMEAVLWNYRGEAEEALARWQALWQEAKAQNEFQLEATAAGSSCEVLYDLERYEEAETLLTALLPRQKAFGGGEGELVLLASINARLGRLDAARRLLQAAEALTGAAPVFYERLTFSQGHARLAVAEQDWAIAMRTYESIDQMLRQAGTRWFQAHMLREWAAAYVQRGEPGDRERARERLVAALELYRECQCPGYVKRVQAQLERLKG
ncbi:MAG: protein kinase [Anaerolineae bacterium]